MKNILVIDDDPMIRALLTAILEPEGYAIECAEDGSNGIEILDSKEAEKEKPFDLVILDVVMPGMNGLDVLTRMKLHTHTKNLPVLMLTGETKAEDIMSGYNIGADYYITKPFTRQQLLFGLRLVSNW